MNIPSKDSVWRSYESDKTVVCPSCGESSVRFVPIGLDTEIDTVGTMKICATDHGTFFHSKR